ncbi:MAG: nuclear transport factor 2 family protein [Arenimonas sp.]
MSDHLEAIKNVYAAFAYGDIPAVLSVLAPNASWTEAEGFPYGGTYIGADAVLQNVFMKIGAEWEGFTASPHELLGSGDTVIALGEYSGTYKVTGKSFKAPMVHVWKFSGDKVITFTQHTDTVLVQRAMH